MARAVRAGNGRMGKVKTTDLRVLWCHRTQPAHLFTTDTQHHCLFCGAKYSDVPWQDGAIFWWKSLGGICAIKHGRHVYDKDGLCTEADFEEAKRVMGF